MLNTLRKLPGNYLGSLETDRSTSERTRFRRGGAECDEKENEFPDIRFPRPNNSFDGRRNSPGRKMTRRSARSVNISRVISRFIAIQQMTRWESGFSPGRAEISSMKGRGPFSREQLTEITNNAELRNVSLLLQERHDYSSSRRHRDVSLIVR